MWAVILLCVAIAITFLNYRVNQKSLKEILAEVKPYPDDVEKMGYDRALECAREFATYSYNSEHDLLPENDTTFDDLMSKYYPDES